MLEDEIQRQPVIGIMPHMVGMATMRGVTLLLTGVLVAAGCSDNTVETTTPPTTSAPRIAAISSGFVMIPAGTKMRMYHARLMARHLPMLGSPEMKLEAIFEEARAKFMDF